MISCEHLNPNLYQTCYYLGSLERLDLTGNNWDYQPNHASMVAEFHRNGRPIFILPSYLAVDVPYDDDP